jgi:hypothetical protein
MLRSILAVIVGYIVMAIAAFALLCGACLGLGIERVFEPESYVVSTLWLAIMVAVTFIGGILGGLLCATISKSKGACMVFAGIVFALGLLFAIPPAMRVYPSTARSGDVTILQAMFLARTPAWILLLNPMLGAVGVLLGARMEKLPAAYDSVPIRTRRTEW